MLLYFAVFSVVSARERHWFWATLPSKTFLSAIARPVVLVSSSLKEIYDPFDHDQFLVMKS
jgi:hypothetical protein